MPCVDHSWRAEDWVCGEMWHRLKQFPVKSIPIVCTTHLHHSWNRAKCLLTTGIFAVGMLPDFLRSAQISSWKHVTSPTRDLTLAQHGKGRVLHQNQFKTANIPVAMASTCLCLLKKHWSWLKKEQHTLRPVQEDETQVASKEPDMPTPCSLAVSKHLPREIHGGPQLKQPPKVG